MGVVLIVVAICWSGYVFFMAVGISRDILPPFLAFVTKPCIEMAHLAFFAGIILSVILPTMALTSALRSATYQQRLAAFFAALIIVVLYFLKRHRSSKARAASS